MSWTEIYIHLVFSTKDHIPYLYSESLRKTVFSHIHQNSKLKDIRMDCVNGFTDHAHCLLSLGREQTLSKVAQLIKGESSYWINKNSFIREKFIWQDDYWAVSVSRSHLQNVRTYIYRQEQHHYKKTFKAELEELFNKYNSGD